METDNTCLPWDTNKDKQGFYVNTQQLPDYACLMLYQQKKYSHNLKCLAIHMRDHGY